MSGGTVLLRLESCDAWFMLTVERQSSSVSVRAVPQQQSVHMATSAADAAVHIGRGCRCPPAGRAAMP